MLNYERMLDKFTLPGESVASRYMDWLLAECEQKQGAVFVAETEGILVGLLSLYVEQEPDITASLNEYLYVSDFVVTSEYRGQGIGGILLAQADAYAREVGQKTMLLHVLAENDGAMSVYRHFGLQPHVLTMIKELE
jgi:GNAT superfamily N-acetyltransferase